MDRVNFAVNSRTRCSAHFKPDDFFTEGFQTGIKRTRKYLKRAAVPWTSYWKSANTKSYSCWGRRKKLAQTKNAVSHVFSVATLKSPSADAVPSILSWNEALRLESVDTKSYPLHQYSRQRKLARTENVVPDSSATVIDANRGSKSVGTQSDSQILSFESFRDVGVCFYTGLKSFDKFMFVFGTLCPEAYSVRVHSSQQLQLSPEDQLLLTLMKLKRNTDDYELSVLFAVPELSISDIVCTWINFMQQMWSILSTWPSKELVDCYVQEFNIFHPTLVLYHAELPIKDQPTNSAVSSSCENKAVKKTAVDLTPGARVTSDCQITQKTSLCVESDKDGASDEGNFNDPKTSSFTKIANGMLEFIVLQDHKLYQKRVRVEGYVNLTETYMILQTPQKNYVPLISKIYGVCHVMHILNQSMRLKVQYSL